MGVNLNARAKDFGPEVAAIATSLFEARGSRQPVPRALFTAALWTRLEYWLDAHAEKGFLPIREAWKSMSSTLGQDVLVKTEGPGGLVELRGLAEDIDEGGALIVRTEAGPQKVLAGDVEQLRPKKST